MSVVTPGRVLTAMVTPFDRSGAVDYAQARRLAAALVASGSDGLVVTGTTGEAPTLSSQEKLRLYAEVKDELGERAAVIAGASDNCTADSIELCREAARTGADALLLSTPYYNKPTQEGLYRHFAAICDAVDLPCIAYNIPTRSALNITAETALRLAGIGNMIGIKESSGDLRQIARIIEGAPEGFRLWTGDDADTFHVMCLGGYGVVSVATHFAGRQIAAMVRGVLDGRIAEAGALHRRLLPLLDALFCVTNPIPAKYALNHLGFDVGGFRLPLCEPDDASAARIRDELARHTIDLPLPV